MKTLPLLLLLATLVTTALSQPTSCWPFCPQDTAAVPGSFTATPVPQSAGSPLEAPTQVSIPDVVPVLPIDVLVKIASLTDPKTVRSLGTASKALMERLYPKLPELDQEDFEKITKSHPEAKAFYRAIIKEDIDAVKALYKHEPKQRIYGLVLAIRYESPKAAWILLASGALEKMKDAKIRDKLRGDAERLLSENFKDERADLAIFTNAPNEFDSVFFKSIILNQQRDAYWKLGMVSGPTRDARITGLHLAVQYGTNMNVLMLLAFGSWDLDMDSEEIKKAKAKLSETDLEFLEMIQTSALEKRRLWNRIVAKGYILDWDREIDHDTAIVGMKLAVMSGRALTGLTLLQGVEVDLQEKLIQAAAALAMNADKSENIQQYWKIIKSDFDRESRNWFSLFCSCFLLCLPFLAVPE